LRLLLSFLQITDQLFFFLFHILNVIFIILRSAQSCQSIAIAPFFGSLQHLTVGVELVLFHSHFAVVNSSNTVVSPFIDDLLLFIEDL